MAIRFYQEPAFSRHVLELAVLVLLFLAAGCGGLKERDRQEAVKEAAKFAGERNEEYTRTITPQAQPIVVVDNDPKAGTSKIVVTPAPGPETVKFKDEAKASADEASSSKLSESESYPFFVKLIGFGLGLLLLLGVVGGALWYARHASLTARAWMDLADASMAAQADRINERARRSTLSSEVAEHTADLAALEKARGKLKARVKP